MSGYLDLLSQVESAEKALVLLESFEVFLEEKQDQVSDRIELAILALSELKTELGLARLIDLCNTPCSVYRVR